MRPPRSVSESSFVIFAMVMPSNAMIVPALSFCSFLCAPYYSINGISFQLPTAFGRLFFLSKCHGFSSLTIFSLSTIIKTVCVGLSACALVVGEGQLNSKGFCIQAVKVPNSYGERRV